MNEGWISERYRVDSPPLKLGFSCVFVDCKGRGRTQAGLVPTDHPNANGIKSEELPLEQKASKEHCRSRPKSR